MEETTLQEVLKSPEIQEAFYHIKVMNTEMGETRDEMRNFNTELTSIKIDNAKQGERLDWLCKFFWVIATASVGSLVASVMQIILK